MSAPKTHALPPVDRLVAAATDLFYQRGFNAVSVEDIVEAGQVTKPTLYRRFHSKDNLGAACLERLTDVEHRAWDEIAAAAENDPRTELRGFITHYARRIAAPEFRGSAFTNAASELTRSDNPGRQVAERFEAEVRSHILDICRRAGSAQPELLAGGLYLLLQGAAASRHFSQSAVLNLSLTDAASILMTAHLPPS
jgi:AcrR family transcriptional regulator